MFSITYVQKCNHFHLFFGSTEIPALSEIFKPEINQNSRFALFIYGTVPYGIEENFQKIFRQLHLSTNEAGAYVR